MAQVRERRLEVKDYADGVRAGDRAMLGRAITLIESAKPEHARMAQALLQELLPETGKAHRVGITGVPGVGKSTMIDRLGLNLVEQGHRVAVLAVDPTSTRSGGSILGDKTRMAGLAQRREAYIRPSPTSGTLGGVARRTREAMALVEAAGFDVVIVETVGVGQSEVTVAGMVDFFLVLLLAGGGDDLQGIKRGIVEIADMIAITKADGDNIARARRAQAVYQGALAILTPTSPNWSTPVLTVSSAENRGLDALWEKVVEHRARLTESGELAERRGSQAVAWMEELLRERLLAALEADADVARRRAELEAEVRAGKRTPALAVAELLAMMGLGPDGAPTGAPIGRQGHRHERACTHILGRRQTGRAHHRADHGLRAVSWRARQRHHAAGAGAGGGGNPRLCGRAHCHGDPGDGMGGGAADARRPAGGGEARPGAALWRVVAGARLRGGVPGGQRLHADAGCGGHNAGGRAVARGRGGAREGEPARAAHRGAPAGRGASRRSCRGTPADIFATPRSIIRWAARAMCRAGASASSTSPRRSAGRALPTAGASAPAGSPGSRPGPAGSRYSRRAWGSM